MLDITGITWAITIVALIAVFVLDFVLVDAHAHTFTAKEATRWVIFYVLAALAFAVFLYFQYPDTSASAEFLAGWVTEYSLSVDNLFVFIVLMSSFAVPNEQKHRVLLVGVALAIFLRGILIGVGAVAIQRFEATFFLFAAFLLYTAISVWRSGEEEPDADGNSLVRFMEHRFSFTSEYHGSKLAIRKDGKRFFTPMVLVMFAVGTTDLMFALDSIPAIFGLTREPYLVFMANAFALMGLRQLYFLLNGLLDRIIFLSKGLAVILGFISIKLFLEALGGTSELHVPHIEIQQSLMFIAGTLGVTVMASLWVLKKHPERDQQSQLAEVLEDSLDIRGDALKDFEIDES
jgi:tellurite resistance protein TerC